MAAKKQKKLTTSVKEKQKSGLAQPKKFNWKLVALVVLVVSAIGGFLVYKGFAAGPTRHFYNSKGSYPFNTTVRACEGRKVGSYSTSISVRVKQFNLNPNVPKPVRANVDYSTTTGFGKRTSTRPVEMKGSDTTFKPVVGLNYYMRVNVRFSDGSLHTYSYIKDGTKHLSNQKVYALPSC